MILYVNGCSHTAAAEAVVPDVFAVDDGKNGIDRSPHPTNLAASWCTKVAESLGMDLICQAESGSSNDRILRTTKQWITDNPEKLKDTFVIIQWTTWEREEWLHKGTWYQVNASGIDWVPTDLVDRYKNFVISVDWATKTRTWHDKIWALHTELKQSGVQHLFFSGHSTLSDIQNHQDWGTTYIHPYSRDHSYHNWLKNNGGTYANPSSYHFDAKSHRLWADYVLQYINDNNLILPNEIRTD